MQIVIDIDEDVYEEIKKDVESKVNTFEHVPFLHEVIAVGTPLPKGHGRLIDADRLETHFVGTEQGTDLEVYLETTIIDAPTIIEGSEGE